MEKTFGKHFMPSKILFVEKKALYVLKNIIFVAKKKIPLHHEAKKYISTTK